MARTGDLLVLFALESKRQLRLRSGITFILFRTQPGEVAASLGIEQKYKYREIGPCPTSWRTNHDVISAWTPISATAYLRMME
jgi:hypothetical protein